MSVLRSSCVLLVCACACASVPEPVKEPMLGPADSAELFHRARFEELKQRGDLQAVDQRLHNEGRIEDQLEHRAQDLYRQGDSTATADAIAKLGKINKTRVILEAMLRHARPGAPLRHSQKRGGMIEVPLVASSLDRGYPILEAIVDGQKLRLLWDTGASENVLSARAVKKLGLPTAEVEVTTARTNGALVSRFGATATAELAIGSWHIENTPWLITDLDTVDGTDSEVGGIDGFLSPQLFLANGCFAIDRLRAVLSVGFDARSCSSITISASKRAALFMFEGELFVSANVHQSPPVAVQIETGSPVSFLRSDASRYLPHGMIRESTELREGEIAYEMKKSVTLQVAGRAKSVSAIDLEPHRKNDAHDDVATLGNDLLLQGRGIAVSFRDMSLATLDTSGTDSNLASARK